MDEIFIKLTNSAYKIIDFFPESDPLKNRAKEKVLSIMDNLTIINLLDGWASFQIDAARNYIIQDIEILLHYFIVARNQGYLNPTNFFILSKEYHEILKEIKSSDTLKLEIQTIPPIKVLENKKVRKEVRHSSILTERQQKIITFLTENQKAQVVDLQHILKGVTKRTIRRDLNELLKRGNIVRVGKFNRIFYQLGHL